MLDHETTNTQAPEPTTKYRWLLVAVVGAVVAIGVFFGAQFTAGLIGGDPWDVVSGQEVTVLVEPGASATSIYRTMHDAGVARSGEIREAARRAGVESQLQAGTYILTTNMDPDEVVRQLLLGGETVVGETFTVIEGWTVDRILEELGLQTGYDRSEYERALTLGAVTSPLLPATAESIGDLTRWEGILFPAKYPIADGATPASILQAMADEMVSRLGPVDWSRADELGISRYEALVIASLIEREAGTDVDRSLISSVIHNRLGSDTRLQIDATVVYAVGDVNGRVTAADLEVDSPYNTYRVDGLPPTPIGTVQIISVEAALDPADTDYLFYVLSGEDGSHAFARTYEEHQENIRKAKEAGVLP